MTSSLRKSALAGAVVVSVLVPAWGQDTRGLTFRAEVAVKKKRYCQGDGSTAVLQLDCHFRFINNGGRKIILHKDVEIVEVELASDIAGLRNPKYRLDVTTYSQEGASIDSSAPGPTFAILAKNQHFDVRRTVPVPFNPVGRSPGIVAPGVYLLQVRVGTWVDSDELAKKLQEEWKPWGDLWTKDLTTIPISVAIEPTAQLHDCN